MLSLILLVTAGAAVVTPKVMTGVFLDIQMLLSRVVICKAEGARDITGKAESGRADRTRQRHRTPRRDAQQFRAEITVNESKTRNFFRLRRKAAGGACGGLRLAALAGE